MANLFDLQQYKCKTCGEPLDIIKAQNGVIKCGVCDSVFTLPKDTATEKLLSFLTQGEHDLDTGKFDDAYAAYSKAAELDKTEPEAYFGMALAEFKIQYLKDEVNNRLQPICHEVTDKVFADSANFLKALRYATDEQRKEYERKAEEIEYIMTEFFKLKKSGIDYDCFICVKVTDNDGGRTEDYKAADDIYFELKGKGYKPFFSERELTGVTGADYEARILYALSVSECMLIVCFDEGYLRTKWVKNEYTRYLKLVNDEEKESDSIALVFGKRAIEKLPEKRGKLQGISINSLSAMERIVAFVEGHTPEAKKRREEEAKRKNEDNEALKRKLAELEARLQNTNNSALSDEEIFERFERARKERERKEEEARWEAERKAREEAEHKARAEAERRKKEEAEKAAAEAERKAREEQARIEAEREAALASDFEIENNSLVKYRGQATEVVIPDGVMSIGYGAFECCSSLTSITIPDGVTSIGDYAFKDCGSLTSITIPDSVTSIGYGAFERCSSLTSIAIPDGVTSIGRGAFSGCGKLKSIVLPNGLTSVGDAVFEGCYSLQCNEYDNVLYLGNATNKCLILIKEKNGYATSFKINSKTRYIHSGAFRYCGILTSITIPDGVKSIGSQAFWHCGSLKSITIPDSVTEIGDYAFSGCGSLSSIVIPDGVTNIGDYAFSYCSSLTSIAIPDGVTSIGCGAFSGCSKLTNITISDSVESIGYHAFDNCSSLIDINFNGTMQQWEAIKKNEKWDEGTGRYKVSFLK